MNRKRTWTKWTLVTLAFVCVNANLSAWWPEGHRRITEAAVLALPDDMPRFFRNSARDLTNLSVDADLWKEKAVPELRAIESPEHFLDWEMLKGNPLPGSRGQYIELCRRIEVDPNKAGTLPYAIQEWYQRLIVAFAEHRKWPDDKGIQNKIVTFAGILAHYTGDGGQPLHTTIHYDGRLTVDGHSPRSGIHFKMDALPVTMRLTPQEIAKGLAISKTESIFTFILDSLAEAHRQVDEVYLLEDRLPAVEPKNAEPAPAGKKTDKPQRDDEVLKLCMKACRNSARLTATVWYAAWIESANFLLPEWHQIRQ